MGLASGCSPERAVAIAFECKRPLFGWQRRLASQLQSGVRFEDAVADWQPAFPAFRSIAAEDDTRAAAQAFLNQRVAARRSFGEMRLRYFWLYQTALASIVAVGILGWKALPVYETMIWQMGGSVPALAETSLGWLGLAGSPSLWVLPTIWCLLVAIFGPRLIRSAKTTRNHQYAATLARHLASALESGNLELVSERIARVGSKKERAAAQAVLGRLNAGDSVLDALAADSDVGSLILPGLAAAPSQIPSRLRARASELKAQAERQDVRRAATIWGLGLTICAIVTLLVMVAGASIIGALPGMIH